MDMLTEQGTYGALMAFYMAYIAVWYIVLLVFGIVSYILCGKSISAIARRRGIEKPWLAWVPVGNMWLLGCISDQYRYVTFHQETNRRGKLLTLSIISMAGGILIGALTVMTLDSSSSAAMVWLLLLYVYLAVAIVQTVLQFKAYFDLFRSCDPDKSLVYLLVSIFASFPLPFFVYSCRNKDLGMPPREIPELPCE